jgi:hypothetical protein
MARAPKSASPLSKAERANVGAALGMLVMPGQLGNVLSKDASVRSSLGKPPSPPPKKGKGR